MTVFRLEIVNARFHLKTVKIAFFNLHGAQELMEYCGKKLAERIKDMGAEVVITAESKGLQLAHCVARELGHKYYAVARKSLKGTE